MIMSCQGVIRVNKLFTKHFFNRYVIGHNRYLSTEIRKKVAILGIETSCDDTGCAIVSEDGHILGEALHSQQLIHLKNGGIIPPIAQDLHRGNIERVVGKALSEAGLTGNNVDAIAVTVKPGLPLSLVIGLKYAKHLARKFAKPLIPIHHMEAHALMARMEHKVDFPYLCLLISGGHCLLTVVNGVDDFILLGQSVDDSPGEAFDKTARRMKLRNLPQFQKLSGGQAIELAALQSSNPLLFEFPQSMMGYKDCNFSMAGIKNTVKRHLYRKEKEHNIEADGIIPEINDLCASFQFAVTRHLCQRTQRAMEYVSLKNLIPENNRTLVVSGGVACNNFIAKTLKIVCDEMHYNIVRPRPKLCTDNGIMIAWNGMERWQNDIGITYDLNTIDIESKSELGRCNATDVASEDIKCKWIKLARVFDQ